MRLRPMFPLLLASAAAFAAGDAAAPTTHYFKPAEVDIARAAGETGSMLIEAPDFKVLASRRDKPGRSEVHATDTDIFVVIDGQATIVVGGKMIEPKEISAGLDLRQRHRRRHQLSTREGRGAHDSAQYAALGARDPAAVRYYVIKSVGRG